MELDTRISPDLRAGRAANTNLTNRFEKFSRVAVDDGWGSATELAAFKTEVSVERPRKVITQNNSPDLSFDQSLNPYRGCEHGCIYCFARPTHAYLGLSPGLDFETKLLARPEAAGLLRKELSAKGYAPKVLAIGTNTDPYQPIEKKHLIMRSVLKVLSEFQHPVGIATKGTLVERDTDILAPMAQQGLARVGISITTLDRDLSRKMEPRVPSPQRRLKAIEKLAKAGIPVRLMLSPVVPGLTDHEIEKILRAASNAGATGSSMIMLRLPREVSPLMQDWLEEHYPNKAAKVLARVREMHGGKDYRSEWGTRMTGSGLYSDLLRDRFRNASRANGLTHKMASLRTDLFMVPQKQDAQLTLF